MVFKGNRVGLYPGNSFLENGIYYLGYLPFFFFSIEASLKKKTSWSEMLFTTYIEDFYKNFVFRCTDSASLSLG